MLNWSDPFILLVVAVVAVSSSSGFNSPKMVHSLTVQVKSCSTLKKYPGLGIINSLLLGIHQIRAAH